MTHPGKLGTTTSFIERAARIMNMAYHISNNGGPEVFVSYNPHVRSIGVFAYDPKWSGGADTTWSMYAYEHHAGGAGLDAIEARLDELMEQL